jgi:3-oxoacyl-[acyl-carrier protein] reductase
MNTGGDMAVLDGKVAIVTGSGRGIGEQVARRLSAAGARVVVNDLDGDEAQRVAASLPSEAAVFSADLTADGACDGLVTTAIDAWGRLDIVVNNAGYAWDGPVHKVSDEQFQAMLDIHTVVPFRVLRAAAPYLREPAKGEAEQGVEVFRKVVNVTSLAGMMGNAGQVAYAAAKGGVVGLTRALAKEWGPLKINVNAVAFGFVDTRITAPVGSAGEIVRGGTTITLGVSDKARAGLATMIPLGRAASPEEAARGVYFLCSPESDYIHGQVLNVSGGLAVGMAG